jgi:hypothetical protein
MGSAAELGDGSANAQWDIELGSWPGLEAVAAI